MGTEDVKQQGSLFIVDPNPPGRDMIPPEDMFIYVKFTATPRSRFIYGGLNSVGEGTNIENGVEDSVDFISTKIKYNPDGKLDPNPQKSFATTSWTNIGGLGPTESRGVLEGFGIKSIDIKYNASLVPVVDITFTDIRGAGLFDTIKDNERLSPYSVFFKMPYPVFNLSVKGYFGQSIDYCLHMVNWTSNFDGTTGNFDISANFLGFQQAFLNDMNIGNIIGTVNTQRGFQNLNDIFDEQDVTAEQEIGDGTTANSANLKQIQNKDGLNVRKLDDFFTKIAKLQIDTEVIKSETGELDKLKQINGQLSILKSIRSFIGSPIPKSSESNNDGESKENKTYYELLNNKDIILTSSIKDSILVKNENYLSVRDYLLINSTQQSSFKTYMSTLNSIIKQYSGYVSEYNAKQGTVELVDDKSMLESFKFSQPKGGSSEEQPTSENYWEEFIVESKPKKLSIVLGEMSLPDNILNLTKTYEGSEIETNSEFNMVDFRTKLEKPDYFYSKNKGLTKDSFVLVVDFRKIRDKVQGVIEELKIKSKEEREEVQKTLNDEISENFQNELGFKPTIDNCFRIISNNTQAMTSTVYDITKEATKPERGPERLSSLSQFQTDIPTDITTPIAWPSVYVENDSEGLVEIYLGDKEYDVDTSSFPEVEFVNEVFTNLVGKSKSLEQITKSSVLKNGLDTDNWFPINPIDYKINPWIGFGVLNDDKSMDNFISKNLFNRVSVLKNYSKWGGSVRTDDKFAALDGIAANTTLISPTIRNIYKDRLEKISRGLPNSIMGTEFGKNLNYDATTGNFIYKSEVPTSISGINIGGKDQKEVDYILFGDEYKGLITNSKRISNEINSDNRYSAIKDDNLTKEKGNYYSQDLNYNNITTYLGYNVWDEKVSPLLKGGESNTYKNFTINDLSNIDLTGKTADDGKGSFLNRTNFKTDNECNYSDFLIQSEFYGNQTNKYGKAVLLLSTLPFKTFKEAVLDAAFPSGKYENAKVINLPLYYTYFIGAYLWKSIYGGIDWDIETVSGCSTHNLFESPNNCYLTKIGYFATKTEEGDKVIEPELLNMPSHTKKMFINKFINWVDSGLFSSFETDMKTYRSNTIISEDEINKSSLNIKKVLNEITKMVVLTPSVFDVDNLPKNLTVKQSQIKSYIKDFLSTYNGLENNNTDSSQNNSESEVSDNSTTNKIKLQIYNYFKNINDKWVSDTEKSFNVCGGGGGDKSLYDYFKFIDRGWNDIGDKATINLSSFLTLGSNLQTSVYFFMSKILRDSNFLLQILPTYLNYKDANEVSNMFKPVTTLSNNTSSGPTYCCIYVGGASQALDIGEKSTYAFANDGFSLDSPPSDMTNEGGNSLVGFRVGFGAENQTIFKNVSLNQQEHKETGEYFKALSELVDKRGGTQKVYQGTDLLKLFKTRSYTCKVDALGCMNIQPLMYFNLENVPFFNGAYLITSVNHSISPNHMTTNFQGVRQSKFISKANEEILADLNLDLNETNEIPKIEFTNLEINDDKWKIGVLDPQEGFDFNKWTVSNFDDIGVDFNNVKGLESSSSAETQTQLNEVKSLMESKGIVTNSQVCMFLANVMAQSNYLLNNETTWGSGDIDPSNGVPLANSENFEISVFDDSTVYSDKTRYYGVNPPTSGPFKEVLSSAAGTISGSTPTFSSGTKTDIAYEPSTDKYDDDKYFNVYPGDQWRFKPRGFLYITGRKEYFEYGGDYLNTPNKITTTFIESFNSAIYVWKNKKPVNIKTEELYKNSYEAAGGDGTDKDRKGTSSDFALTNEISCSGVNIESTFNAFEAVLLAFNLKDDNNP